VLCSITPPTHSALLNDDPGLCRNPPIKTGPVLEGRGRSNPGALKIFLKEIPRIFFLKYATKITEDDENGL
jgi:hypothetical protein